MMLFQSRWLALAITQSILVVTIATAAVRAAPAAALVSVSVPVPVPPSTSNDRRLLPLPPPPNDAPGTHILPFPLHWYSLAAGLAQGTYCLEPNVTIGSTIGDATILERMGDGQNTPHVITYHTPTLGVVLAYQGTNLSSIKSLLYDANFFWHTPDAQLALPAGTLVDSGFQDFWLSNWEQAKQMVHRAQAQFPDCHNVTVTGHSLGAAAAVFAALALGNQTVNTVLTFGQPRMGTQPFASTVDERFGPSRLNFVTNGDDPVPHLLPRILLPPPQQFSGQVWINPGDATLATHGKDAYTFYPGQEDCRGPDSVLPTSWNVDAHEGYYM